MLIEPLTWEQPGGSSLAGENGTRNVNGYITIVESPTESYNKNIHYSWLRFSFRGLQYTISGSVVVFLLQRFHFAKPPYTKNHVLCPHPATWTLKDWEQGLGLSMDWQSNPKCKQFKGFFRFSKYDLGIANQTLWQHAMLGNTLEMFCITHLWNEIMFFHYFLANCSFWGKFGGIFLKSKQFINLDKQQKKEEGKKTEENRTTCRLSQKLLC